MSYHRLSTESDSGTYERQFVQGVLEYTVPEPWVRRASLQNIKAEALLRSGTQEGLDIIGTERHKSRQGHLRLSTTVSERFQGSLFYRRNDLYDDSREQGHRLIRRDERTLVSLSHEEWRLIQVNLRTENTLDRDVHRNEGLNEARLAQFSQINLRISPGRLWSKLSPFHLELNLNRAIQASGATSASSGNWVWQIFSGDAKDLTNSNLNTDYFVKNEYRPSPALYIYSLVEWNRQETTAGSSELQSDHWRWTEKFEAKLGLKSRLNLQYRQYSQNLGYARTARYYEPSLWFEHRWTPDLQSIFNVIYRRTDSNDWNIGTTTDRWDARYDLIWRGRGVRVLRRVEARQSLSANHSRAEGYDASRTYGLTYTSGLDLYPAQSVVLRTQVDLSRYWDDLAPQNDYSTLDVDLKISLRF
jgi:hypothetical protein